MNYLQRHRNKQKERQKKQIFISVFFSVLLFAFFFYMGAVFLSNSTHKFVAPVWRFKNTVTDTFSPYKDFIKTRQELILEKKKLQDRQELYSSLVSGIEIFKSENDELRQLLEMRPYGQSKLSRVLARPPQTPYDILIIDGGKDREFEIGDQVYFGEVTVLGEIDMVYDKSSKVILYSAPQRNSEVFIDDCPGILSVQGRGGGKLFTEVPRSCDIEAGDYFLKIDNRVSVLGEVIDVFLPETGAVKLVTGKVPVDIFSLKNVFVVSFFED